MNVMHIIWDLGQGGAQTYLLNLVSEQKKDPDLQLRVLVLTRRGALSDEYERLVKTEYLGMSSGHSLLAALQIPSKIKESNVALIHVHSNNILLFCLLHLIRLPIVYTEHGGGLLGGRYQDRLIYKLLHKPVTRWIAISEYMANVMQDTNPSNDLPIDLVYNGVNAEQISATTQTPEKDLDERITSARYRVGVIGRLHEQKGIDLFVRVAGHLHSQIDDTVFIIVGDGGLRPDLEAQARQLNVDERVFFLGYRKDAIAILKNFTVFLFTSKFEPFGLVIAEAMAAKVPVVATHSVGAIPEILSNRKEGIVVSNRDPSAVADAVVALLQDSEKRDEFRQSGSRKVRELFSITANAKGVKRVYGLAIRPPFGSKPT